MAKNQDLTVAPDPIVTSAIPRNGDWEHADITMVYSQSKDTGFERRKTPSLHPL